MKLAADHSARAVLAAITVALSACGGGASSKTPQTDARAEVGPCDGSVTADGGCSTTAAATDKFLGTSVFDSGMFNIDCQALSFPLASNLANQTLGVQKGTTSDLVSTLQTTMGTCTLPLTVNGTTATATATAGNTCIFNVAFGGTIVPVTVSITSWTMTTVDGRTATISGTATGTGFAAGCPVTIAGSTTKQAPTDGSVG